MVFKLIIINYFIINSIYYFLIIILFILTIDKIINLFKQVNLKY